MRNSVRGLSRHVQSAMYFEPIHAYYSNSHATYEKDLKPEGVPSCKHTLHQAHTASSTHCIKHTLHQAHNASSTHCLKHTLHQAHNASSTHCIKHTMHQAHTASSTQCIKHTNKDALIHTINCTQSLTYIDNTAWHLHA